MGVPRFFRWLSERYPMINQAAGNGIKPEFDCLYLDMNGIIHNCANKGASQSDLSFEPAMYEKIYAYIDKLFSIVQPRKLLFLALDGVAPRAKMNQQRQRRFRSAAQAKEDREDAARRGEIIIDDPFDSNCITPGTEFMDRLSAHMEYFIRMKIRDDAAWRGIQVIFSGADAVGEGEHKILRYIRNMKMQPDYNPNLRHCLYGLDADLIMLSLLSHEPHIALLREEVVFGSPKNKLNRKVLVKPDEFQFLHISILREYLKLEFSEKELKLPFAYDFERILDDWILLAFLVGNDFLPNLPSMDIGEGGLDTLYSLYKEVLPTLGGYITHWGNLNRSRLEVIIRCLALREDAVFAERAAQKEKDLERGRYNGSGRSGFGTAEWAKPAKGSKGAKGGESAGASASTPTPAPEPEFDFEATVRSTALEDAENKIVQIRSRSKSRSRSRSRSRSGSRERSAASDKVVKSFNSMAKQAGFVDLPSSDSENSDTDSEELNLYEDPYLNAQNYYRRKFPEFFPGTPENAALPAEERSLSPEQHIFKLCGAYIEGICWCLKYYYAGIQSWRWFYPYRFVPLASSLRNLDAYKFKFDLGRPFTPLEQLLGVLPPLSAALLPAPYRRLMLDDASPIKDFYPEEFDVDMNDKKNSWEGIALIPFIDEKRLLEAVATVDPSTLTEGDRDRNRTTERYYVFTYDPNNDSTYVPPQHRVNPTCLPIHLCKSQASLLALPRIPLEPEWADDELRATLRDLDRQDGLELFNNEGHVGSQVYVGDAHAAENLTPQEVNQHYYIEGRFLPILPRGCKTPLEGFPSLNYITFDSRLWVTPTTEESNIESKEPGSDTPILSAFLDTKARIDVFGSASRKGSLIMNLPASRIARFSSAHNVVKLLQKAQASTGASAPRVWCDYPYVREAQVVKVMDSISEYVFGPDGTPQYRSMTQNSQHEFNIASEKIANILNTRCGIRAGQISAIVCVRLFEGMERLRDGSVRKRFSTELTRFPAQLIVVNEPFRDGRFIECEPLPFEDRLKPGTRFMYVGRGYYGSEGEIVEITKTSEQARAEAEKCTNPEDARKCVPTAKVRLSVLPPPNVAIYKRLLASPLAQLEFFPSYMLARELGISGLVLSQICTTVNFNPGNTDLGLNIRFSRLGLQVADYARRVRAWGGTGEGDAVAQGEQRSAQSSLDIRNNNLFATNIGESPAEEGKRPIASPEASPTSPDTKMYKGNDGEQWHYSSLTAVIVAEYIKTFPEVFAALAQRNSNKSRFGVNIAPFLAPEQDPAEYVDRVKRWLSKLAVATQIAVPCDSLVVPARAALVLEELGEREHAEVSTAKVETIEIEDVTDREIYTYNPAVPWSPSDSIETALADRVVTLRSDDGVPVNTRGTVVAVHGDVCEVIFDVPFVSGSKLNGKCKKAKGKLIPKKSFLNLTQAQPQYPSGEPEPIAVPTVRRQPSAAKVTPETTAARSAPAQEGVPSTSITRQSSVDRVQQPPRPVRQASNSNTPQTVPAPKGTRQASGGNANVAKPQTAAAAAAPKERRGPAPAQTSKSTAAGTTSTAPTTTAFPPAPVLTPNIASILNPAALAASSAPVSTTTSVPTPTPAPVSTTTSVPTPTPAPVPVAPSGGSTPTAPAVAQAADLADVRALLTRISSTTTPVPAQSSPAGGATQGGASPYAYVPVNMPLYGAPVPPHYAAPGYHFAAPGFPGAPPMQPQGRWQPPYPQHPPQQPQQPQNPQQQGQRRP